MAVQPVRQDSFAGGMWRSGARDEAPPNTAYELQNFLIGDDGKPYRRGGDTRKSNAALGAAGLLWAWSGWLAGGLSTAFTNTSTLAALAVDDVTPVSITPSVLSGRTYLLTRPVAVHGILYFLGTSGGTTYLHGWAGSRKADYSTGTVTVTNGSRTVIGSGTAWNANADAGMLLQGGSLVSYPVRSISNDTTLTLADPWPEATAAGSAYGLHEAWVGNMTAILSEVSMLATVAGRLLMLGGKRMVFTPPNSGIGITVADTDFHEFPADILGGAGLRDTALVFTTGGLYSVGNMAYALLDTAGNPQQSKQLVNADLILWGHNGIASWAGALVVPALDNVWLVDGVSAPTPIGDPIKDLYLSYVQAGFKPGIAEVFNGHYFLPVLNSSNVVQDVLVCRMRPARGGRGPAWTRLTGDGANVAAFAERASVPPLLLGASRLTTSRVTEHSSYFNPASAVKNDATGTTHQATLETRELAPADQPTSFRRLRVWYELTDAATDNPTLTVGWRKDSDTGYTTTAVGGVQGGGATVGGTSDGSGYRWWQVEKRARAMRARVVQNNATSNLKVRAVEWVVEGSQVP